MGEAEAGSGRAAGGRRANTKRRRLVTVVCVVLVGMLGLAQARVNHVPRTSPAVAGAAWPAFTQTAADAGTWLVALRTFASAETAPVDAAQPPWPAFTQTAADAGNWLVALRNFAITEVQVEQAAQAAQAAQTARAAQAAQAAAAARAARTVTVRAAPAPERPAWDGVVPAPGQATAWGCDAALAYLSAYAAPGFTFECPGYAEGHEGMTCLNESACPNAAIIAIAVACPQSYMNEASNSWVLTGRSDAPIDPYGGCAA